MSETVPFWLLRVLYPLPLPQRTRNRPMKVLCLGLGRTGTESLKEALLELGYENVYHGFQLPTDSSDAVQWARLGRAKHSTKKRDPSLLVASEFDKILGECDALSDIPPAMFGVELLRAYPDAKVVLNSRDVDRWYESQLNTVNGIFSALLQVVRAFSSSELFWLMEAFIWCHLAPNEFDFAKNGKEKFKQHYAEIQLECRRQGREWLEWKVEDGWEPLCKFLDRPVPQRPFPKGNASAEFEKKLARALMPHNAKANRNVAIAASLLILVLAAGLASRLRQQAAGVANV